MPNKDKDTLWTILRDMPPEIYLLALLIFALGFSLGAAFVSSAPEWKEDKAAAIKRERDVAIDAGVGRYKLNPATGKVEFAYGKH